jgi:hypothetical protein
MESRRCPRALSIPVQRVSRRPALSEDERLITLGRLLTDADTPMRLRVAGVIVLLYAQPLTRIVQLTVDDVIHDGETRLLRLGEPASPVPASVAPLLLAYIADRDNMNTATNQASRWLFPGRRAGQPPDHLSALLGEIGVPVSAARGAAIRHQLLELPAPVVADALGYHDKTTSRLLPAAAENRRQLNRRPRQYPSRRPPWVQGNRRSFSANPRVHRSASGRRIRGLG